MAKHSLDAFFHMACHGDKEAMNLLYEGFVKKANKLVKGTIKRNSNFRGFSGDFCDLIDELFFRAINEYEQEKGSFNHHVNYLLERRLRYAVLKEIADIQSYTKTIDFTDDELDLVENLPDPNSSLAPQIALKDFKLKISSPNAHKDLKTRRRDKVLTLYYAGYSKTEISKLLNISYRAVRYVLENAKDDEDLSNIKLDLK